MLNGLGRESMTNLAVPIGARVLVTGSTGSVGSAVANELLKAGLRVRAIVRNLEKGRHLFNVFRERYGPEVFEIVHAEDLAGPEVLREAMIGCAGVVHMATDTSLGTSPEQVISPMVDLARAVLETAVETPTVRRVVFTSSAATLPRLHEPVHITPSSWASDDVVRMAWSCPPHDQGAASSPTTEKDNSNATTRALIIYAASKIEAERACWAFMTEEEPKGFVLNTVVPMTCLGAFVHPRLVSSMNGMLLGTWQGDPEAGTVMQALGIQCHIDLEDLGLLHLAALVLEDVQGERIVALGEEFGYDDVLDVMRKIDPGRKLPEKAPSASPTVAAAMLATVERGRYRELLARMGKEEPTGLGESIQKAVASSSP